MKMNPKGFVLILVLLHAELAWAYVDPGSGMLMIQGLIALIAGMLTFVKSPWKMLKAMWRRFKIDRDA